MDAVALVSGTAVPVSAAAGASTVLLGVLGAIAALATGIGQIFGWRRNWTRFASTLQSIERQSARFRARDGEYADTKAREAALVLRVENLVAAETGAWQSDTRSGASSAAVPACGQEGDGA